MQLGALELATDGARSHDRPPAVGLAVAHDERRVHESTGRLEVQLTIAVRAAVDHGRVGEWSPDRGERPPADPVERVVQPVFSLNNHVTS